MNNNKKNINFKVYVIFFHDMNNVAHDILIFL